MDSFVVLIFLCLFTAQAACRPTEPTEDVKCTEAMTKSLQLMRQSIGQLLDAVDESKVLPNTSCPPLNTSGQPIAHQLSSFRCEMMKLSELIPELKEKLKKFSQYSLSVEKSIRSLTVNQTCSLPHFEQQMDIYLHAKCQLKSLDQQLSKICPIH